MKKKMQKVKVKRDKDGYEYGGPDLSGTRMVEGSERSAIIRRANHGPLGRFIQKVFS